MPEPYVPERGDIVWIDLDPALGHEQAGRRPAIVLSDSSYNRSAGLAVICPVTSRVKDYPFEVAIPPGLNVRGVILADHVKSLSWTARNAELICTVPTMTLNQVLKRAIALLRG